MERMTRNTSETNTTDSKPVKFMASKIKFDVVKEVKSEVFRIEDNVEKYFEFTGPIRVGATNTGPAAVQREKGADVAPVKDLEQDGKEGVILLGAALRSQIEEAYPGNGYVGKQFRIKCLGRMPGKRYKGYAVTEIRIKA